MPKSIIREFDGSTAGIALSSDFAVVVPGYMGKEETEESVEKAKAAGIYIGDYTNDANRGVYELKSQAQFLEYIGPNPGQAELAKGPTLEPLVEAGQGLDKFFKKLSYNEILADKDYCYYANKEIFEGPEYKQQGRLLKSFDYSEQGLDDPTAPIRTFKFTSVGHDEIEIDPQTGYSTEKYVKILKGNEGNDAIDQTHIGNQIAYELLGLGYTVLFKRLYTGVSATSQLQNRKFWEPLKDKSTYHFRYLMSGGCYDADVMTAMSEIALFGKGGNESEKAYPLETAETYGNLGGRGDVIALCDVDETNVKADTMETLLTTMKAAVDMIPANKYTAIFAPRVVYNMKPDTRWGGNVTFPASFHYLACAIQAQQRYAEWYAVAGYTRGVASKAIAYTTLTFGEIAINTLAPRVENKLYASRAVNLILYERGSYYLWGNRTSYPLNSDGLIFSHFLNIRQLCTTIKKDLYQASRAFTFDPNSDLLWTNFVGTIRPTLEAMKVDQGIKDYRITRVADERKALLKARIRIVPIEALEDFDISVYLENSLSGIVVSTDEELAE